MGFTNYIAGLSNGLEVPNPAADYASKLAFTAPWRAARTPDPTGYVPQPVPAVCHDEQTGLDYHRAITRYEADIASGVIQFGPEGFADSYPGQSESNKGFDAWVKSHVAYPDEFSDQEFPIR